MNDQTGWGIWQTDRDGMKHEPFLLAWFVLKSDAEKWIAMQEVVFPSVKGIYTLGKTPIRSWSEPNEVPETLP